MNETPKRANFQQVENSFGVWDDCYTQEKLKTKFLQNLEGKQVAKRANGKLYNVSVLAHAP